MQHIFIIDSSAGRHGAGSISLCSLNKATINIDVQGPLWEDMASFRDMPHSGSVDMVSLSLIF